MSRPSWRLGTLLLALFLIGAAAGYGVAALRTYHGHEPKSSPRRMHTQMIDRLDRDLKFTPEQRERVREILDRKEAELREHRRLARRDMLESREATRREIERILDEPQRAKYRTMVEKRRARWGSHDTLESGR